MLLLQPGMWVWLTRQMSTSIDARQAEYERLCHLWLFFCFLNFLLFMKPPSLCCFGLANFYPFLFFFFFNAGQIFLWLICIWYISLLKWFLLTKMRAECSHAKSTTACFHYLVEKQVLCLCKYHLYTNLKSAFVPRIYLRSISEPWQSLYVAFLVSKDEKSYVSSNTFMLLSCKNKNEIVKDSLVFNLVI